MEYQERYWDNFDFTQSNLTDDKMFELIDEVHEDNDFCSHHKYDIGRTKHKFNQPLEKDATFKKQHPSKVIIHLRGQFE